MADIPAPIHAIRIFRVGVLRGFLYNGIQFDGRGSPYRSGGCGVGPLASSGRLLVSRVGSLSINSSMLMGSLPMFKAIVAVLGDKQDNNSRVGWQKKLHAIKELDDERRSLPCLRIRSA